MPQVTLSDLNGRRISLDFGRSRASFDQRALQRHGLQGVYPATTAAILSACSLKNQKFRFLDVGANGGLYSFLVASLFKNSRVTAIEPDPRVVDELVSLTYVNRLKVDVRSVAISDKNGTATFFISNKSDASSSLTEGFRESESQIEVPTVTLDRLCGSLDGEVVMKIDVEQHELAVLQGGQLFLTNVRPLLIIELSDDSSLRLQAQEALRSLGYEIIQITPRLNFGEQEDDALRDYLAIPEEKEFDWVTFKSNELRWSHKIMSSTLH